MTIKNTGWYKHIQHFYGLSSDTKPTTVEIGDKFTEIDTEVEFLFNGTEWIIDNPLGVVNVSKNHKNSLTGLVVDIEMLNSTFTEEYTTNQTSQVILTPSEGHLLCIRNVEITTDATSGVVSLDFATSEKKVARLYTSAQNRSTSNTSHLVGAIDEPLKLTTTTGAKNVFIVITYIEHK